MLALLTARALPLPLAFISLFLLLTAAAALLACGPSAQQEGETADPTEPPPPPTLPTPTYPKLRHSLQHDVVQFEEAQDAASGPSGQSDSAPADTAVYVEIFLSGNKAEVAAWLRSKGVTPGHADDPDISGLDAYVPLSLLGELSQQDGVTGIRQPRPVFTDEY